MLAANHIVLISLSLVPGYSYQIFSLIFPLNFSYSSISNYTSKEGHNIIQVTVLHSNLRVQILELGRSYKSRLEQLGSLLVFKFSLDGVQNNLLLKSFKKSLQIAIKNKN